MGDPEKYRIKLTEKFPGIKFVVAKKADSLYPVVSGASIVAKVISRIKFPCVGYFLIGLRSCKVVMCNCGSLGTEPCETGCLMKRL